LDGTDRVQIEALLTYLGTLRAATGQLIDVQALVTITALLSRADAAERAVLIYQAEALRTGRRATSAERRALAAEEGAPAQRRYQQRQCAQRTSADTAAG
jgi:hypothetical protein